MERVRALAWGIKALYYYIEACLQGRVVVGHYGEHGGTARGKGCLAVEIEVLESTIITNILR